VNKITDGLFFSLFTSNFAAANEKLRNYYNLHICIGLDKIKVRQNRMKLKDIALILNAEVICGQTRLEREVEAVFASDLMSDVLTIDSEKLLLLTGLVNIQTIRTSEMSDIKNIVLVRNKKASPEMIALAEENRIVILECSYSMYKACGLLFENGINPVY